MTKAQRRDKIKEVNEARQAQPPQAEMTYWLTRDSDADGVLSEFVDVWLAKPARRTFGNGGAYWTAAIEVVETGDGPKLVKYLVWTKEQCLMKCKTYPDDDRQCIRVGDDVEPKPAEMVS